MFVDADFGGCLDTRRSTGGILILFNGAIVMFRAKRHNFPTASTSEAEYVTLSNGVRELIWVKGLLAELGYHQDNIPVFEDNQACIRIATNPVQTQRTKSIDIAYHIVRHYAREGVVDIKFCSTDRQMANLLTKACSRAEYVKFASEYFLV